MAYESYCAACTYLGETKDYNGKYYCSKEGDIYACDEKCHNYCEAYSRSNYKRETMYKESLEAKNRCYLTTIMCHILNYKDNNHYLETLRNFRDKTMKTNQEYLPLLYIYDFIGPIIADNLKDDPNRFEIASTCFERYIKQSVEAIDNGKEKIAINIYQSMTYALAERYNMNLDLLSPIKIPEDKSLIPTTLGHGKTRKLISN